MRHLKKHIITMNLWQELVQLALMGADRGRLSDAARAQLEALGVPPDASTEQQLLEGAAILHQLRRAALELPLHPAALPAPIAADQTPACSSRSSHHLHLILRGDFRPALPEFVEHLLLAGRSLPSESLPPLFDQCLGDPALWQQISPAIGPIGHWLLTQNPAWAPLRTDVNPEDWPTAEHDRRCRILRVLHRTDPEKAHALLVKTWDGESFRDKLDFLEAIGVSLHADDAGFLESALDDRRKEVRLTVAELLSRLPASPLVERMFQRAVRFLHRDSREKLMIQVPETLEKDWIRDGIQEKPPAGYSVSPKTGWFLQLIARVPPARWADHWRCSPADCLHLFAQAGGAESLMTALTEAAARHPDSGWNEAWFQFWIDHPESATWQTAAADAILQRLAPEAVDRIAGPRLERRAGLVVEHSPIERWLQVTPHPWSELLGRLLISGFQQWLGSAEALYSSSAFYRRLLELAAYRCPPTLLEEIRRGWPMQARSWPRWEEAVEQFLNTLVFRREMRRALE